MRILVTAGNTQVPIDRVRCITNIFTGRTGTRIALEAHRLGHDVRLLTSQPNVIAQLQSDVPTRNRWHATPFQTFDDLQRLMETAIRDKFYDAVIHSAAVSDYLFGGAHAPGAGTRFDPATGTWTSTNGVPSLQDRSAGKVKSDEPELWLRMIRAPKIVDRVRADWGFQGVLVKFKLEVGIDESTLENVAERSRQQSAADLMVANTLEGAKEWALLGPVNGRYARISRDELPVRLLEQVVRLHEERRHG
jgi:phosphopantothenoylcysteine synthetase/decarboxylase